MKSTYEEKSDQEAINIIKIEKSYIPTFMKTKIQTCKVKVMIDSKASLLLI